MKKYRDYKDEIGGYNEVYETMKVIEKSAAAKIHTFKNEVQSQDAYIQELQKSLGRLSLFLEENGTSESKNNHEKKILLLITGDKGIVGKLYHELIQVAVSKRSQYDQFLIIGKKGIQFLREENIEGDLVGENLSEFSSYEEIQKMNKDLFQRFEKKEFSKLDVLHSQFFSIAEQKPQITTLFPFNFDVEPNKEKLLKFPIFDPSKKRVYDELLKKYQEMFFYKVFLESKLSEISSRVLNSGRAIKELELSIKKLKLYFFKERRMDLTQRQLETFTAHKII